MELSVVGVSKSCVIKQMKRLKARFKNREIVVIKKPSKLSRKKWEAIIKIEK